MLFHATVVFFSFFFSSTACFGFDSSKHYTCIFFRLLCEVSCFNLKLRWCVFLFFILNIVFLFLQLYWTYQRFSLWVCWKTAEIVVRRTKWGEAFCKPLNSLVPQHLIAWTPYDLIHLCTHKRIHFERAGCIQTLDLDIMFMAKA